MDSFTNSEERPFLVQDGHEIAQNLSSGRKSRKNPRPPQRFKRIAFLLAAQLLLFILNIALLAWNSSRLNSKGEVGSYTKEPFCMSRINSYGILLSCGQCSWDFANR